MHHQHGGLAQLLQGYYVPNSLQLERGEPELATPVSPQNSPKEIAKASFHRSPAPPPRCPPQLSV